MSKAKLIPLHFGDFLVERRAISDEQLLDALAEHWMSGTRLGETLCRRGYLALDDVERFASEFHALKPVYV